MKTEFIKKFIKKVIKYHIKTNSIEFIENDTHKLADVDEFELYIIYEIVNKENQTLYNEFFVLGNFKIIDINNIEKLLTKTIFIKIGFSNDNIKDIFKELDILDINIQLIKSFDHWKDSIDLFKRHYNFTLSDKYTFFLNHLDSINFSKLFGDPKYAEKCIVE